MKSGARVRYTNERIKEAFRALLEEKPVTRITVRELCQLAEINRATFYNHYLDIFDLLEKLEDEALDHLRESIRLAGPGEQRDLLKLILSGAKEPRWGLALLCGPNGDSNFPSRIFQVIYEEYLPVMGEVLPGCTEEERRAVYRFMASGSGGIIADWIKGGMEQPAERIVEQLLEICSVFVHAYRQMKAEGE